MRHNFYTASALDRVSHRREDADWIARRMADPVSRFVPVWRSRNLVVAGEAPRAIMLSASEARIHVDAGAPVALLGLIESVAHFAVDLSNLDDPHEAVGAEGAFEDLRVVGPLLDRHDGALLAYAKGLFHWQRRHQYCGVCGRPTKIAEGGHVRTCSEKACGTQHFPRIDPAVIMLVTDGERCLLGRQPIWPPGMHSTLAGFVEPGESLEGAVMREVEEETGIKTTDVAYQSSQPWPFPSSLMLGFRARALTTEIRIAEGELESAGWFTRAELLAAPEDETFRLPRRDSIARRLVDDWLAEG